MRPYVKQFGVARRTIWGHCSDAFQSNRSCHFDGLLSQALQPITEDCCNEALSQRLNNNAKATREIEYFIAFSRVINFPGVQDKTTLLLSLKELF